VRGNINISNKQYVYAKTAESVYCDLLDEEEKSDLGRPPLSSETISCVNNFMINKSTPFQKKISKSIN
jgi:hypothetical protein